MFHFDIKKQKTLAGSIKYGQFQFDPTRPQKPSSYWTVDIILSTKAENGIC